MKYSRSQHNPPRKAAALVLAWSSKIKSSSCWWRRSECSFKNDCIPHVFLLPLHAENWPRYAVSVSKMTPGLLISPSHQAITLFESCGFNDAHSKFSSQSSYKNLHPPPPPTSVALAQRFAAQQTKLKRFVPKPTKRSPGNDMIRLVYSIT